MSNLIEKLAAEGHLTSEQSSRIQKEVDEFMKLAAQDPEFCGEALEKLAGPMGVKMMDTAKMLGGIALVGGAMNVIGDVYDTARDAIMKSVRYKRMVEANPQLRQADSKAVQRAFSTLHTFNPDYASDPTVAGQFIDQQLEREGMDFSRLKSIIDAGKSLQSQRRQPMTSYLTSPQTVASMVQFEGSPESMKRQHALKEHGERMKAHRADTIAAEQRLRRSEHFNKGIPGLEG